MSQKHPSPPKKTHRDLCPEIRIRKNHTTKIAFETSPQDPITYRKLRRRNGDCSGRAAATLLVILILQVTGVAVDILGIEAAAYLNGVNPNSDHLSKTPLPSRTTKSRYAFVTRPRDQYFTSTGFLPPLAPTSSDGNGDDKQEEQQQQQRQRQPSFWVPPNATDASSTSTSKAHSEEAIAVTYTNDPETVDSWLCHNVPYDGCLLGFDIERLPLCRSENPDTTDRADFAHAAVVQLATMTSCLVVHLVDTSCPSLTYHCGADANANAEEQHPKHSNACARILRRVLEDPSIVKAGCSIDEDLVLLHELWSKKQQRSSPKSGHVKVRKRANAKSNDDDCQKNHPRRSRTKRSNRHQKSNAKSRKAKGGEDDRANIHKHHYNDGPSLQARSRFDLGCVVLPKPPEGFGEEMEGIPDWEAPIAASGERTHYRIVAKRTNGICNKSGLQGLCKSVLGVDLPKEKEDSASDWTRFPLTDDQITYAARDAWAGVAIAEKLASMSGEDCDHSSNNNKKSCGDEKDDRFRANLIRILAKTETPLPQLARRHRQRKEAKTELQHILHPYAKNLFLNQQNRRRHLEWCQNQTEFVSARNDTFTNSNSNNTMTTTTGTTTAPVSAKEDETIDVQALFANYPLPTRKSLANYAQKQQQLMEKSLPKRIRKRSVALRQIANARVIDHKVVFEIKLLRPDQHHHPNPDSSGTHTTGSRKQHHHHHHHHHHGSKNRRRHNRNKPKS